MTQYTVYMRVHRDTGYYFIGYTNKSILSVHKKDVSYAKRGVKLNSLIVGLIWGIILRDGDPVREFELIEVDRYITKKEADDATKRLIYKYSTGDGDRPADKLLNQKITQYQIDEIDEIDETHKYTVYMRVHRDTESYFIGYTNNSILTAHKADVSYAKNYTINNSRMYNFIRDIILRGGDPVREFELIKVDRYITKQEADDATKILISKYYKGEGDRPADKLLNQKITQYQIDEIDETHKYIVYMRVHRDTESYFIGYTNNSILTVHKKDVSLAKNEPNKNSRMYNFIRDIILRGGDPVEEFEIIEVDRYITKKEADDATKILISKYYKGEGDRPSDKLLNRKNTQSKIDETHKYIVYMRVHRDTGFYYIGHTDLGILNRHRADISSTKNDTKYNSRMIKFIRDIILRGGDPVEEFELIEIDKYKTKKEAADIERILISKYYKGEGDRPFDKLLNSHVYRLKVKPVLIEGVLKRYVVNGTTIEGSYISVMFGNIEKYTIEELKSFAEEYAETGTMPENYEKTKCGGIKKNR